MHPYHQAGRYDAFVPSTAAVADTAFIPATPPTSRRPMLNSYHTMPGHASTAAGNVHVRDPQLHINTYCANAYSPYHQYTEGTSPSTPVHLSSPSSNSNNNRNRSTSLKDIWTRAEPRQPLSPMQPLLRHAQSASIMSNEASARCRELQMAINQQPYSPTTPSPTTPAQYANAPIARPRTHARSLSPTALMHVLSTPSLDFHSPASHTLQEGARGRTASASSIWSDSYGDPYGGRLYADYDKEQLRPIKSAGDLLAPSPLRSSHTSLAPSRTNSPNPSTSSEHSNSETKSPEPGYRLPSGLTAALNGDEENLDPQEHESEHEPVPRIRTRRNGFDPSIEKELIPQLDEATPVQSAQQVEQKNEMMEMSAKMAILQSELLQYKLATDAKIAETISMKEEIQIEKNKNDKMQLELAQLQAERETQERELQDAMNKLAECEKSVDNEDKAVQTDRTIEIAPSMHRHIAQALTTVHSIQRSGNLRNVPLHSVTTDMEDGNKTVENNDNDNGEQVERRPRKYSEAVMASSRSTIHNKEARDVVSKKDIHEGDSSVEMLRNHEVGAEMAAMMTRRRPTQTRRHGDEQNIEHEGMDDDDEQSGVVVVFLPTRSDNMEYYPSEMHVFCPPDYAYTLEGHFDHGMFNPAVFYHPQPQYFSDYNPYAAQHQYDMQHAYGPSGPIEGTYGPLHPAPQQFMSPQHSYIPHNQQPTFSFGPIVSSSSSAYPSSSDGSDRFYHSSSNGGMYSSSSENGQTPRPSPAVSPRSQQQSNNTRNNKRTINTNKPKFATPTKPSQMKIQPQTPSTGRTLVHQIDGKVTSHRPSISESSAETKLDVVFEGEAMTTSWAADAESSDAPMEAASEIKQDAKVQMTQPKSNALFGGFTNHLHARPSWRLPDETKPMTAQKPYPPCNRHYLLEGGCVNAECHYLHDFLITQDQLTKLRLDSKKSPCAHLMRGNVCASGAAKCHMGHSCPYGALCPYGDACKFTLPGMHDADAILPPPSFAAQGAHHASGEANARRPRTSSKPSHTHSGSPTGGRTRTNSNKGRRDRR